MMIAPEIRRGHWFLTKDGDWFPFSSRDDVPEDAAATISGYGSRLFPDDPWILHPSYDEAAYFIDLIRYRHGYDETVPITYIIPEEEQP